VKTSGHFYYLVVSILVALHAGCSPGNNQPLGHQAARILDSANLFNAQQKGLLFEKLDDYESTVGPQIAVVTIETLGGKNLNEYSLDVANQLQLGRKKYSDGILITVVSRDRQMRIEVGTGLEGIIRDEIAGHILTDRMAPKFRQNKFYEGIFSAIDTLHFLINRDKTKIGKRQ